MSYACAVLIYINLLMFKTILLIKGESISIDNIKKEQFICDGGTLLSKSVCIPRGYRKGEVPHLPTVVNTKIEINNIREVDDKKMRITLDYYQELNWKDNRIKTKLSAESRSVLNTNLIKYIWKPDLWIKNLFKFELHGVLEPTSGLVIAEVQNCEINNCTMSESNTDTTITYNFEAQATIYCNFYFLRYPMDTQECHFIMDGSYPYPDIVNFRFLEGHFGITNNNFNTDDFILGVTFDDQRNGTGIYCYVKMERCILPFMIRYYIPCIATVVVSFIGFLLSLDSIPARVALLVTQFLTLTNILIAQQVRIDQPFLKLHLIIYAKLYIYYFLPKLRSHYFYN